MPRGDKSSYTSKQRRKAEHIEEGYENRGVSRREAARRAWATVNDEDGGGKKSGSGRGRKSSRSSSRKGGRKGAASRSKASRSVGARKGGGEGPPPAGRRSRAAAARKGAATRRRRARAGSTGRKSTGGISRSTSR